jgi:hypothetical protein
MRRPILRSPTATGWVLARSRLGVCSLIITRRKCRPSAGTATSRPGGRNWASMMSSPCQGGRSPADTPEAGPGLEAPSP